MSENNIKNKIVVLSGKGGVGKSTVAVNLAVSLALKGNKVGLLDVDVHGPSIPTLLNLEGANLYANEDNKTVPLSYNENLKVVSIGFMIDDMTSPIIWKGPIKAGYIKEMLTEVEWGELDYLVVDCPPGTGEEPLTVIQALEDDVKTVVVTTPQKLSIVDVKKSINFCKKLNTKILGVIENMSGLVCPHCNEIINVFDEGGGEKMAKEMDVNFLGKIPLDINVSKSSNDGKPYVEAFKDSTVANLFSNIVDNLK